MSAKRILLIEDDPSFHAFVKDALEKKAYTVNSAYDGVQATQILNKTEPNLILVDLLLPEKDGIRFITETKQSHPSIPIIAMSGGVSQYSPSFLKAARSLGASHILEKPFVSKQLLELVDKCINGI
ncbi:MAG: response regulator [Gammaproteobacteria bacterium]|nr:MAG: response regulator [Gammaproteobacteria bacterium]